MSFLKRYWLLLLIIFIAFLLRLVGITYGYPLILGYDEKATLAAAMKMLGTHSLRANAFQYYYPAGLAYIYLPWLALYLVGSFLFGYFASLGELKQIVLLNLGVFLPAARLVSVFLGTASVWLIYFIAQRLFKHQLVALISAWFLAVSFFHVASSHYARTWAAQTFFILLVLYWAVHCYQKNNLKLKDYLWAGILIGLAFSINFVGLLAYYWFVLVHYLKNQHSKIINIFIKNKNFWLTNFIILMIIFLVYYLNPFGLDNYFGRIIHSTSRAGGYFVSFGSTIVILANYLVNSFIQQPIFFLLALIGSWLLWRQQKIVFLFLVPWVIIYYLFLSPMSIPMVRYTLPVIPLIIIIAAYFIAWLGQKYLHHQKVILALIILISLPSFIFSFLLDYRLTRPDTRQLARQWVIQHIPAGASINNLALGAQMNWLENKAVLKLIKQQRPNLLSTARKYLLVLPDQDYPQPSYFVVNYKNLLPNNHQFDYIILGAFNFIDLKQQRVNLKLVHPPVKSFYPLSNQPVWPERTILDLPFNKYSFSALSLLRSYQFYGPYIEIYQLNNSIPNENSLSN